MSLSAGFLPSGLSLSSPYSNFASDGFILISGTASAVTSSLSATISATNSDGETGSISITFTINTASPSISTNDDTATLGTAKTVAATLADAYLQAGDGITFTATSGGVSVPATATANGGVDFALSAADINTLGVGTHTFTISQTGTSGNAVTNNNTVVSTTFSLTIAAQSASDKAITAFSLPGQVGSSIISGTNITVTMPYGTDVTSLAPNTITVSPNASVTPGVGVTHNFTNPVTYTVTAQDGTMQDYSVSVSVQGSPDKAITAFSLPGQVGSSIISGTNITVTMPFGTNVTALVPTIQVSPGATVSPDGTSALDFSSPVTFTVMAADGTTTVYTVSVKFQSGGGSSDDFEPLTEPLKTYEQAIVIKVKEWANIRSGPSLKNDIIGRVRLGDTIELLQWNKDETWCKIIYTNMLDGLESTGWLWHKFIRPIK